MTQQYYFVETHVMFLLENLIIVPLSMEKQLKPTDTMANLEIVNPTAQPPSSGNFLPHKENSDVGRIR
jgi:hypothetical protein